MEARSVYTFVELATALKTVLPNYTRDTVGRRCIPRYRKYRLSTGIYVNVARIFSNALYSRGRGDWHRDVE